MPKITNIKARQIIDSRGNPTVECDIEFENSIHLEELRFQVEHLLECMRL